MLIKKEKKKQFFSAYGKLRPFNSQQAQLI